VESWASRSSGVITSTVPSLLSDRCTATSVTCNLSPETCPTRINPTAVPVIDAAAIGSENVTVIVASSGTLRL
jgi:hypothetical protein